MTPEREALVNRLREFRRTPRISMSKQDWLLIDDAIANLTAPESAAEPVKKPGDWIEP